MVLNQPNGSAMYFALSYGRDSLGRAWSAHQLRTGDLWFGPHAACARGASRLGIVIDHVEGSGAFGSAIGFSEPTIDARSDNMFALRSRQHTRRETHACSKSCAVSD